MAAHPIALEKIINLVIQAGKAVLTVYETNFDTKYKDDTSPLTTADKQSHNLLTQELSQLHPHIPILSEEGQNIPHQERKEWKQFWLIDPLDGTKEFIKRNGEFTINVALIHNTIPVLGIVYLPVKAILYFARKQNGAYKINLEENHRQFNNLPEVLKLSQKLPLKRKPSEPFTVIVSRSHLSGETADYINKIKEQHQKVNLISAGSSLKFCLIAEGTANIYPRLGPTMEWDTAAAHAIVNEAGKKIYQYNSEDELSYNKENLRNGWFIVK